MTPQEIERNNKIIFHLLAREYDGERWHDHNKKGCSCGDRRSNPYDDYYCHAKNPSFYPPYCPSEWEAFGWMWERLMEKEWFEEFITRFHVVIPSSLVSTDNLRDALLEWARRKDG